MMVRLRLAPIFLLFIMAGVVTTAPAEEVMEIKKGISIFGSSELPKGLTIIPWQTESPDAVVERLQFTVVDEIFRPVEREVLRRQLGYYQRLFVSDRDPVKP